MKLGRVKLSTSSFPLSKDGHLFCWVIERKGEGKQCLCYPYHQMINSKVMKRQNKSKEQK